MGSGQISVTSYLFVPFTYFFFLPPCIPSRDFVVSLLDVMSKIEVPSVVGNLFSEAETFGVKDVHILSIVPSRMTCPETLVSEGILSTKVLVDYSSTFNIKKSHSGRNR